MKRTRDTSTPVVFKHIPLSLRLVLGLLLLIPLLARPAAAQEPMPETMAYQGYLTNTDGDPAEGTATVVFSLYDEPAGGSSLWQEIQQGVLFTDGVFSVHLGSVESLEDVSFDGPLWLGISVAGSQELTPRVALEAVPYAMSVRGLRVVPGTGQTATPSLIGGYAGNVLIPGVSGAVIGGGGAVIGPDGGGASNIAAADFTTIGGGGANQAGALYATVGGGYKNVAQGAAATIGGGDRNAASGLLAFVGGGRDNRAETEHAVVAGGLANKAIGDQAAVGGGENNTAANDGATVGGGRNNEALGCYDTVAGGESNRAEAEGSSAAYKGAGRSCNATVGGGRENAAIADAATVAGGVGNTASGGSSVVGGGRNNKASGNRATVPGGEDNQARGDNSLAAGTGARAAHFGAFVWADDSSSDSLVSTAANQFLIRASGGVGIGTNAPQSPLHVTETDLAIDAGGFSNDALVVEGAQPVVGVYASFLSNTRPGLVLAGVNESGNVVDKWAIVREFFSGNALHFTYGLNEDHTQNATLMTLSSAGGNSLSVPDGTISSGRLRATDTLGPAPTPSTGSVYQDNVVYAWAHVQSDGSVSSSYGCTVSKQLGSGSYRVSFKRQLPNGASAIVTPQTLNDPVIATVVTNPNQADVATKVFNGAAFVGADYGFYIQVVGRP